VGSARRRCPLSYPAVSEDPLALAGAAALAFAAGAIPFGVLLARRRGVDIRTTGSGNIGATNVARVVGLGLGLVVLVLDAAKGAAPVLVVRWLDLGPWTAAAAGLGAVLGHCFSPWLGFRGGKGVATALGVFLALDPLAAGAAVATFAVFAAITRIPAVGSLAGTAALAALCIARAPLPTAALAIAVGLLILVRHRSNLAHLLRRQHERIDD
jgi:glycerol-3-phosphate acyltransferase PlsY